MKKLAIIGCGYIGTYHLEHLVQLTDRIELVGFCDLIAERAESFVQQAGCGKAYTDFRVMYEETTPDMVFICVPPAEHGDMEYETIARGIHFFVEKPTALNMKLVRDIEAKVRAAGLITAVGFQSRYDDFVAPVRQFVQENKVAYLNCTRISNVPGVPWWKVKELSGGQLAEQTVHEADYMRYTVGEPKTVFSMATRGFVDDVEGYDTDDLTVTNVQFENGMLATIATGCYSRECECYDSTMIYSAKDKRIELHSAERLEIISHLPNGGRSTESMDIKGDYGMDCDKTFVDAVISGDGSAIRSPYSDAMLTMAFVLACNRSMETGMPVNVTDMFID